MLLVPSIPLGAMNEAANQTDKHSLTVFLFWWGQ